MHDDASLISYSPSFETYSSSSKLADIATRVVQEFNHDHEETNVSADSFFRGWNSIPLPENDNRKDEDGGKEDRRGIEEQDNEFEFSILCKDPDLNSISADDIFCNGQIRPIYPLFNTDLVSTRFVSTEKPKKDDKNREIEIEIEIEPKTVRIPLGKLFSEEREGTTSTSCSSSSETDNLEGVEPGTYCVWTSKKDRESALTKKSSSTGGSSKRWKFRDLLQKSSSDGKSTLVFLAPINHKKAAEANHQHSKKKIEVEEQYGRMSKAVMMEKDKRRPYLPYRPELVGVFANGKELSRNFNPTMKKVSGLNNNYY